MKIRYDREVKIGMTRTNPVTIGEVLEAIGEDREEEWQRRARAWLKTPAPSGLDPVSKHLKTLREAIEQALEGRIPEGYSLLLSVLAEDPGFAWGKVLAAAARWAEKLGYEEDARILQEELASYTQSWASAFERSLQTWIEEVEPTALVETLTLPLQAAAAGAAAREIQGKSYRLKLEIPPNLPNQLSIYVQYIGEGSPPRAVRVQHEKNPLIACVVRLDDEGKGEAHIQLPLRASGLLRSNLSLRIEPHEPNEPPD